MSFNYSGDINNWWYLCKIMNDGAVITMCNNLFIFSPPLPQYHLYASKGQFTGKQALSSPSEFFPTSGCFAHWNILISVFSLLQPHQAILNVVTTRECRFVSRAMFLFQFLVHGLVHMSTWQHTIILFLIHIFAYIFF